LGQSNHAYNGQEKYKTNSRRRRGKEKREGKREGKEGRRSRGKEQRDERRQDQEAEDSD